MRPALDPVRGEACPAGASQGGACAERVATPPTVTLAGLLDEMVDLERLAQVPRPSYASRFVSSHDRHSDDAAPGTPGWFANHDFIALRRGETATLLEASGPGALTRIWSASPAGLLRVFVDGAQEPAIEAPFADLLGGGVPPFEPPFAVDAAGGKNLYFPIPFAESLRITLAGPVPRSYYHLSYRAYAEGTRVEPFGPGALESSRQARVRVATRLSTPKDADASAASAARAFDLDSASLAARAVIERPRGGAITWLRLRPASADPGLLRATVLSIAFDGAETVRVPLAGFFAVGHELQPVDALPIAVDADATLTSRWTMPFRQAAVVALESTDGRSLKVELQVAVADRPWTADSLYFHAFWQPASTFPSKPPRDLTLLAAEGRGLYVGNVLDVVNRNEAWWGEGDEKIYVDGESFPSHFGTGTEDYYGYAWCSNERFTRPYFGQPLAGTRRNYGHVTLYRFHVLDPIPFTKALRFDLEVRHWGPPVDVTYDATSFWYGAPARVSPPAAPETQRPVELEGPPPDFPDAPYRCGG